MERRIGMVDLSTGEILEGVPVWVGRKKLSPYGRRFFMANQDAWQLLASDRDLTGETYRVFFYLCSRIDFENYIQVPQMEIVEALGMRKEHVSRAMHLLVEKGILIRGPKVGRSYSFRLNPNYGYKGKVHHLRRDRTGSLYLAGGLESSRCGQTPDMFPA